MSYPNTPHPAVAALDGCQATLEKLEKLCCVPGRSPRMKALGDTLNVARSELGDPEVADVALAHLEDVGAQVGRLQVGCCAPARMPLYASFLEGLMTAQRSIKAARGDGH